MGTKASMASAAAGAPPARANPSAMRSAPAAQAHRLVHRGAQGVGVELVREDAGAGAGPHHELRDLELVTTERDDADGHAGGESLLGDPHPAVAHDTRGAVQDRTMREPALDVRIRWRRELRGVVRRRAHRDLEVVGAESRQCRLDEDRVGLKLTRCTDQDERMLDIREEGRRLGRRFPVSRPDHPERRRQLDVAGTERRRRVVELQRRAPDAVGVGQGLQPDGLPRAVEHVEPRRSDLERHHRQVAWYPGREGEVLEQRDRLGPRDRTRLGHGGRSHRGHVDQQIGRVDVRRSPG